MQFHSKPIEEHTEVPLADDGKWEELTAEWAALAPGAAKPKDGQNHCYVVCVAAGPRARIDDTAHAAALAEILALVGAQGDAVVGHEQIRRDRPDPRTYLGSGACSAIAGRAREAGADMLVLDAELSPSQMRNIEDATGLAVAEREGVILNVFLRHAKTRKARIQVEIAQLEYLRPRIRGLGLDMDQQAGGMMNARGPGETASELLARQLDGRLIQLRRHAAKLDHAGAHQRSGREGCARIALVGYTNAGKTSLMNGLTQAQLSARDMPFETLDTTTRSLTRHGGDVVISDTVGFIRRLPARLLASFETTLAQIREASLLVIVVDLSDPEWTMHLDTTKAQLGALDAAELPRVYVYNKLDRLAEAPSDETLRVHSEGHPFVALSSHDAEAVAALGRRLIDAARPNHRVARVVLPYAASEWIGAAYAGCRVSASEALAEGLALTLEGPAHLVDRIVGAGIGAGIDPDIDPDQEPSA